MKNKLNLHHLVASAIIGITISSCASLSRSPVIEGGETSSNDGGQFNNLVSRDVVSVLSQISELSPARTTLGTSNDAWQEGNFADALKQELESAGYAIRSVGAGEGTTSIGYSVSDNTLNIPEGWQGQSQTVTVSADDIAVRRSYLISAEGIISPLGKMQVRGVDASTLTLQRDIFDAPANSNDGPDSKPVKPESATVPTEQLAQNTLRDAVPPKQTPQSALAATEPTAQGTSPVDISTDSSAQSTAIAAEPAEQTAQSEPLSTVPAEPLPSGAEAQALRQSDEQLLNRASSEPVSSPEKKTFLDLVAPTVPATEPSGQAVLAIKPDRDTKNVMELQQSNYEDLFADMAFVSEKVLTFANDSTQMGDVNKVRLQELVDDFEAESDMVSVVGCSLGHTNYAGGQEELAMGRAMRVREELLYAGIPGDNIVEEGCWADEAFDLRMPRRGVVVTLKRRAG